MKTADQAATNAAARSQHGFWMPLWVIDACEGDMNAARMLAQLLYWLAPDAAGLTRARSTDGSGRVWIARQHDEWWDECRLTPDQAKRAAATLRKLKLVDIEHRRFGGMRVAHYALRSGGIAAPVSADVRRPVSADLPPPVGADLRRPFYTKRTTEITTGINVNDVVRAAARTTRHAPTEGMGEGISEPNDAPTSKPSRPSKPARPAEPTPTRQRPRATPKPQAPQAPEEREGPFREVFQAICRVRRQSPDILAEEDRANTRRLTSTLCRAGVEDRETVEGWGRGWYADMATRTRRRASQVSAPTIAQLTTWFGGRIAERDDAHLTIETTTGADSGWMTN